MGLNVWAWVFVYVIVGTDTDNNKILRIFLKDFGGTEKGRFCCWETVV